jgi:hypothetical protein
MAISQGFYVLRFLFADSLFHWLSLGYTKIALAINIGVNNAGLLARNISYPKNCKG